MVADIHAVDFKAFSMLPGVANLQVAEPSGPIEGALLLLTVQTVHVLPASVVVLLCLDALVRQVVEV